MGSWPLKEGKTKAHWKDGDIDENIEEERTTSLREKMETGKED